MKTAVIETIADIKPHPNADRLELATIQGWQCVVGKGEFKPGDRVVYVPIDTILPETPWTAFLKGKLRVRTVKLRGEFSQGIVFPLTVLPEPARGWQEGADVGAELGVKKYEKEIVLSISGAPVKESTFPHWLAPRTDEDNGLSNKRMALSVLSRPCFATLKLDGSSCTVVVEDGAIRHVCSRNLDIAESSSNAFWHAAKKLDISRLSGQWVIQGELMGPGIQGNQLELTEPTLYVFQVRTPGGIWVEHAGFPDTVPFLGRAPTTLEGCQEMADKQVLPNGKPAEGIVVRPVGVPSGGSGRPLGFKIINRNYGE